MYLFKKNSIVQTFHISLGPHPVGQKEREGDGKTPEGMSILDWQRFSGKTVNPFHISYPNSLDIAKAATKGLIEGSIIMVHGTSKGSKKKD
ncbi:murein L,D-transpeptidase YafK [Pedobacter sp. UYEF25]